MKLLCRVVLLMSLAVASIASMFAPAGAALPPNVVFTPGLRPSPPVLVFGAVAAGETRERTLSITNSGSEAVEFTVIGVNSGYPIFGWNSSTFLGEDCPLTGPAAAVFLLPGDTCSVTVTVQPPPSAAPGEYEGTFLFGMNTGRIHALIPLSVKVR